MLYIYIYTHICIVRMVALYGQTGLHMEPNMGPMGPYGTPTGGPKGLRMGPPMVEPYGIPLWVPMGPKGAPICVFPKCSHKSRMYKSDKRERDTELKTI
jgi:hypothetical protein